ncbi:hypothetical protein OX283_010615 [Flavobacterium sp. SUN052]|uniref:hypothetical protein n=1 Tax=Flavobacterium sp. SUN052 TaxID=3002441 RepID=UPI00237E2F13|nr:hypothetical protein [Flavobacterium sp. SUN052]MEC4005112.1 hypothetical protein [Flavobacterium sp. SUN052]
MKTLKTITVLLLFVFAFTSCDTNDDDFYNTEYISVPNLVAIQTQSTYNTGDYIYIESYVNRLLAEPNQASLLDIRKTTNNAPSFTFSYLLERKINATDWELVDASFPNIDLNLGKFVTGSFYNATAEFNTASDRYEFLCGIKLPSAGQYRLSFGYNSSETDKVELQSDSKNGDIFLTIISKINGLDSEGFYNFTVN